MTNLLPANITFISCSLKIIFINYKLKQLPSSLMVLFTLHLLHKKTVMLYISMTVT